MNKDIQPNRENIRSVFQNNGEVYKIDFYQREYKWRQEEVETLLIDIFYSFNPSFNINNKETIDKKLIENDFGWYYLSTFITSGQEDGKYIIDGQQRITSCMLILMALKNIISENKKINDDEKSNFKDELKRLIANFNGVKIVDFRIVHNGSFKTLTSIFENKPQPYSDENNISSVNIYDRYQDIRKKLEVELTTVNKLKAFYYYFLGRVVLVELQINNNDDIPMVFEIINDRGLKLKSHEILKGKLLGKISKNDRGVLDSYLNIWNDCINKMENKPYEIDADSFFSNLIRGKYSENPSQINQVSENNYHKEIYNRKIEFNDPKVIKNFIDDDFNFYTDLTLKLYNDLSYLENSYIWHFHTDLFLPIIYSYIETTDKNPKNTVNILTKEFSRAGIIIRLQGKYDNNEFSDFMKKLTISIRGCNINQLRTFMDNEIKKTFSIEDFKFDPFWEIMQYSLRKEFVRFLFASIEEFISKETRAKTGISFQDILKTDRSKVNYQIDHIFADNKESRNIFKDKEEIYERERNRLGAILLLRSDVNQSLGNKPYKDRFKVYTTQSEFLWNQTLSETFSKNRPESAKFVKKYKIKPIEKEFLKKDIEERQKALFNMIKNYWEI